MIEKLKDFEIYIFDFDGTLIIMRANCPMPTQL